MTQRSAVVIGAGIVGCLVARELAARDPEISITVLDRDAIGSGASRRSIGLHLPRGATARTRRMAAFSHAYYADLQRRHPGLPIRPIAATVINTGTGENNGAGAGELPGGYLDLAAPVPIGEIPNPEIMLPEGFRAWRITGCHHTDVYQLAQAVAAELRPRVRFLEGVAVTGLESRAGTVTVRGGSGEQLTADFAVLAPGPWLAAPAWRDRVATLGLRVKKVAALHIEQRPDPADEAVLFDSDDAFLLPLAHRGHWLFSYSCPEWDVDPDALTAGLAAADIAAARDCLRRYAPGLADACSGGRVFCDAYSPGREPLVSPLDDTGRLVFAGAANGSGYRLAPAIGSEAADLLHPSARAPQEPPSAPSTPRKPSAPSTPSTPSKPSAPRKPSTPRTEGVTGDHQHV